MRSVLERQDLWTTELGRLGFEPVHGGRAFRRNGTVLDRSGRWTCLRAPVPEPGIDLLRDPMGRPGLWRLVREGGSVVRICEVPPDALTGAGDDFETDGGGSPLTCVFDWVLTTFEGRLPPDWAPPPKDEVQSWIGPGKLTVRSDPFSSQGALLYGESRLGLAFCVCKLPEDLPAGRLGCLRGILLDAVERWRLVRLGFDPEGRCVQAEVDLSGAPRSRIHLLFRTALESLRWVVGWILTPVTLTADTRVAARVLDSRSAPHEERKN